VLGTVEKWVGYAGVHGGRGDGEVGYSISFDGGVSTGNEFNKTQQIMDCDHLAYPILHMNLEIQL
jgi:hypothetical protein